VENKFYDFYFGWVIKNGYLFSWQLLIIYK
jgi:hypothetical protein